MIKRLLLICSVCVLLFNNCTTPIRTTPTPKPQPEPPVTTEPKPAPPEEVVVEETPLNTLTSQEVAEGWSFLFDGLTTDGWHTYGSRSIGTAWKTVNGTLFLDAESKKEFKTNTGGDIVTDEEFGNFDLKLDWKISKNGNSGICFYVKEDRSKYARMWNTGPEMQVLDNDGHPDGKIKKHRSGDLYDLISASSEPVKKVGEWNHVRIHSLNGKLDFYLNNVHILSTTMWTDSWRNLIANSKFNAYSDFGTYRTGRIGLQDHGDNVWFRNIKIRRL